MKQFIDLIQDILDNGTDRGDRTGVGTRAVFGRSLRFNLADGFPIQTTRKVSFRIAFEETMFFLRGETNTKKLEDKKINIWKGNTSREFLDGRGLTYLPEGNMGKGYGHQWVRWDKVEIPYNRPFKRNLAGQDVYKKVDLTVSHINQVKQVIEGIKSNPYERRHIIQAWNPGQLDEMALPPCHLYNQYVVMDGKLNSSFVMRSTDLIYGAPYNIMGYAFMNIAISKICRLDPGELVFFGNDIHIYNNQIEIAREQIKRTPMTLPKLQINKHLNSYEDLCNLEYTDIEIVNYNSHPDFKDKPPMAI